MAASFSFSVIPDVGYDGVGKLKLVKGTLTISETPTAGGDAPAASLFNLNTIYDIQFSGVAAVANGATGVWNIDDGSGIVWGNFNGRVHLAGSGAAN